uniref:Uncharacterized protein, isoform B n=1 Tax=Drosophila melanogaster TaxID=7227 RepID=A0A0B4K7J7_DROME|nr:uncharacterized protein Dmel_CG13428, isoform B [Drosophila melanogaster]AFH08196.1 uncharacterized protein Dmel_CG13428, isoform B [Drosophila melanogaster]|eukprot:NP_001246443.1 uncharacterized protein Dmel_CG13428, isoform B [Drosophila melanogaster]
MKLLCVVLVIYVVALTLFGVDGRGGGTTNGVEEPKFVGLFRRSRRDTLEDKLVANDDPPPPPQFRQRRQAPPGMPPPPDGLPPPPQFLL